MLITDYQGLDLSSNTTVRKWAKGRMLSDSFASKEGLFHMLQLYVYMSTLTVVYRRERVFKSNGQINKMHKNTRTEPDRLVCFDSMTAVSIWIIEHTLYDTKCHLQQMARLILCQPLPTPPTHTHQKL